MKHLTFILSLALLSGAWSSVQAQEDREDTSSVKSETSTEEDQTTEKKQWDNWKGSSVQAGLSKNTGNSETSDFNARLELKHQFEDSKWSKELTASTQLSSSDGEKTAQRFNVNAETDYDFAEHSFFFGRGAFTRDDFNAYLYSGNLTAGYGYRVLKTDTTSLDLQSGPDIRFSSINGNDVTEVEPILYVAAKYAWKISDNATFTQDVGTEIGTRYTRTTSRTAVKAKIIGQLSLEAAFQLQNNSSIPDGSTNTEKTDTETTLNLVYDL